MLLPEVPPKLIFRPRLQRGRRGCPVLAEQLSLHIRTEGRVDGARWPWAGGDCQGSIECVGAEQSDVRVCRFDPLQDRDSLEQHSTVVEPQRRRRRPWVDREIIRLGCCLLKMLTSITAGEAPASSSATRLAIEQASRASAWAGLREEESGSIV